MSAVHLIHKLGYLSLSELNRHRPNVNPLGESVIVYMKNTVEDPEQHA